MTKDADFIDMFLLRGVPEKLLLISTGNISNDDLEAILSHALTAIVSAFATYHFLEFNQLGLIIRS